MMEHRRSPVSLEQSSLADFTSKRHKADLSLSSKQKKEKVSERISALQQLVSPFGKTDTASVLLEAMEYIGFLHEQVKVLSAPYLYSTPTNENSMDMEPYSLRSKGLCLVPISFTAGVASSNGADIWAPIKTRRPVSDEDSVITHC
ncbi:transcription factor bHLH153-like [Olea europaea var. sylvestris]|uniref:Transcription factor bHLH113 isoform X2 n=1 Tax=Olea europaea subsp. europaea TaxID=158383 RepID=A0A8S0VBQ4_OLEEU|nr:transcription factor bHLH153-like [Olea europaea var. sylvestris]CAA3031079.1 transcription factor bHLH113 isoform X2 [Olea europaea subsp. europaea]